MVLAVKALAMDSPMPHSFLHQIVCDIVDKKQIVNQGRPCVIVTLFKHEPTHKTVWDVRLNGNVFPGLTVWDVHKNRKEFLGLTVCDIHTHGIIFWDSPCGMYIPMEIIFSDYRVRCTYLWK